MKRLAPLFTQILAVLFTPAEGQDPVYAEGKLQGGKRSGIWKYYDSPGNLGLIYNHTTEEVLFCKPDTAASFIKQGEEWVRRPNIQIARVKGSYEELYTYLQVELAAALKKNLAAVPIGYMGDKFYVGFAIDESGKLTDASVLQSTNEELNTVVSKVFLEAPFDWIPGQLRGSSFTSLLAMPIAMCQSCSGFMPRVATKEDLPLPCPVLPLLVIQKKLIDKPNPELARTEYIDNDPGLENVFSFTRTAPIWSEDGTRLLFLSGKDLFIYDPASHQTTRLTKSLFPKHNASWIDAGYLMTIENNFGVSEVFLLRSDSSKLINMSQEIKYPELSPHFEPISGNIYYHSARNSDPQLFRINFKTGKKERIIDTDGKLKQIHFSADGRILLEIFKDKKAGVFEQKLNGELKEHIRNVAGLEMISLSPDGNNLLYSIRDRELVEFRVLNLTTGIKVPVPVINGGFCFWEPGGRTMILWKYEIADYPTVHRMASTFGFGAFGPIHFEPAKSGIRGSRHFLRAIGFGDEYAVSFWLYRFSLDDNRFEAVTKKIKGIKELWYCDATDQYLFVRRDDIFLSKGISLTEPEKLVEDAHQIVWSKTGNWFAYSNTKNNLWYLYDMKTKDSKPLIADK